MIVTSRRACAAGAGAAIAVALAIMLHGLIFAFFSWLTHPLWRLGAMAILAAALVLAWKAITHGALDPHEGTHAAPRRDLGWPELETWRKPQLALSAAETLVTAGHSANWAPRFEPHTEIIGYGDLGEEVQPIIDAHGLSAEEIAIGAAAYLRDEPPAVVVTDNPPKGRHEAPRAYPFLSGAEPYCSRCGKAGHWRGDEPCPDKSIDELITRRRDGHVADAIAAHLTGAGFKVHDNNETAVESMFTRAMARAIADVEAARR
jgi:hypothetical protein